MGNTKFQFLIGRLKTVMEKALGRYLKPFQFLIGRLKTNNKIKKKK